jgi:hypothetical protein
MNKEIAHGSALQIAFRCFQFAVVQSSLARSLLVQGTLVALEKKRAVVMFVCKWMQATAMHRQWHP